jgi:putative transposase
LAKDKDWDAAVARFEAIRPLLESNNRRASDVERVAANLGRSGATIYRWLARFEETGLVSSLLRTPRSDKGDFRLTEEVEEIIDKKIKSDYLKKERPFVMKLYRAIEEECDQLGLDAPNRNTVYARVRAIEQETVIAKRFSTKRARNLLAPLRGSFPPAEFPNAVVQIDHTKVDVIVVDETHRLPVGRPYLTGVSLSI